MTQSVHTQTQYTLYCMQMIWGWNLKHGSWLLYYCCKSIGLSAWSLYFANYIKINATVGLNVMFVFPLKCFVACTALCRVMTERTNYLSSSGFFSFLKVNDFWFQFLHRDIKSKNLVSGKAKQRQTSFIGEHELLYVIFCFSYKSCSFYIHLNV